MRWADGPLTINNQNTMRFKGRNNREEKMRIGWSKETLQLGQVLFSVLRKAEPTIKRRTPPRCIEWNQTSISSWDFSHTSTILYNVIQCIVVKSSGNSHSRSIYRNIIRQLTFAYSSSKVNRGNWNAFPLLFRITRLLFKLSSVSFQSCAFEITSAAFVVGIKSQQNNSPRNPA